MQQYPSPADRSQLLCHFGDGQHSAGSGLRMMASSSGTIEYQLYSDTSETPPGLAPPPCLEREPAQRSPSLFTDACLPHLAPPQALIATRSRLRLHTEMGRAMSRLLALAPLAFLTTLAPGPAAAQSLKVAPLMIDLPPASTTSVSHSSNQQERRSCGSGARLPLVAGRWRRKA